MEIVRKDLQLITLFYRGYSTSSSLRKKITLTNIKNKKLSSQLWVKRQLSDPFVEKAKMMNYRCRSAFKLIEINEKHRIMKPGQTVIDCGAAPGSWTQVAVKEVNSDGSSLSEKIGKVISIDKSQIYPIKGSVIFGNMDFTYPDSQVKIKEALDHNAVDIVLSDMAPKATGIRDLDNENMLSLCYNVLRFAAQTLKVDGTVLVKMWQCGQTKQFEIDLLKYFAKVRFIKPLSSRSDSTEIFILGKNFRGIE